MKKLLGILLILAAIALGIFGYKKYDENKADLKIGDLELSAKNTSGNYWIYWGIGGISLVIGIGLLSRKK